jgi:heme/copper-type cytochrome/quinol oxidase subunit 3
MFGLLIIGSITAGVAMMANNNQDSPLLWGLLTFILGFIGGLFGIIGAILGSLLGAGIYMVKTARYG